MATTNTNITDDMVPDFVIEIGEAEITKSRVIAAVRAVLMLITSIGSMVGFAFDVDSVYQIVLVVLMAVSMIWGYWKNNNWTEAAVGAQAAKNSMVVEEVTEEDSAEKSE